MRPRDADERERGEGGERAGPRARARSRMALRSALVVN